MNNQNILDSVPEIVVPIVINEEYLEELKKSTSILGDFSFNDDTWYCYKQQGERIDSTNFRIHFHKTPEKHKEKVKFFTLLCDLGISTRKRYIKGMQHFFEYLCVIDENLTIADVTQELVYGYRGYLARRNDISKSEKENCWKGLRKFFNIMSGFPGIPDITLGRSNPFLPNSYERKSKRRKPIPKDYIEKLDTLLFDLSNDIPLVVRVHYWTMRFFPNRVNEVSAIKLDCLTPHFNHYILRIPSWKINGGHKTPTVKAITIGYHGIMKEYIDMIKQLQKQVKSLHKHIGISDSDNPEFDMKKYLFLYESGFSLITDSNGIIRFKARRIMKSITLYNGEKANRTLKQICMHLGIDVKITTHHFRHNSVTSRSEFGFTDEQIMARTGHKSKAMKRNYEHMDVRYTQAVQEEVIKHLNPVESSPVIFRGTILNLKNKFSEKVLKQKGIAPYLVGMLKKPGQSVGVCSQTAVEQCAPNGTPIKYECYACNWFVPIADRYDEYLEDYNYWKEKSEKVKGNSDLAATYENAIRNMALLKRVLNICENGIEKHSKQLVDSIKEEPIYDWQ